MTSLFQPWRRSTLQVACLSFSDTSRNVWQDLWIKHPEDKEWKLAGECRGKEEAAQKLFQELDDEFGKPQTERQMAKNT